MADIALRFKADFDSAIKAFKDTGYSAEELQEKYKNMKKKMSPEAVDNFTKKQNLNAAAFTATRGPLDALIQKTAAYQREIERLIKLGLSPEDEAVKKLYSDYSKMNSQVDAATASHSKFAEKSMAAGRAMTTFVTLPLVGAAAASIKFASDYEESLNKVNVAFGSSVGKVKSWSETTLESIGMASGSALDAAALFGDMATSMDIDRARAADMSIVLTNLSGDWASFKNIKIEVANTALKSVFTGETESLKMMGVVMTEANLKSFALASGIRKKYETMTQAEKVMLRYNFVMDASKNAIGDFARTGGGAANQMRMFTEGAKQLGQSFGSIMLPAFTVAITKINDFVKYIKNLDEGSKELILTFAAVAAALGPALILASSVVSIYGSLTQATSLLRIMTMAQAAAQDVSTVSLVIAKGAMIAQTAVTYVLAAATKALNLAFSTGPMVALTAAMIAAAGICFIFSVNTNKLTDDTNKLTDAQENYIKALEGTYQMAPESRKALEQWDKDNRAKGCSSKQLTDALLRDAKKITEEMDLMSQRPFGADIGYDRPYKEKQVLMYRQYATEIMQNDEKVDKEIKANKAASGAEWLRERERVNKDYDKLIREAGLNEIQLEEVRYQEERRLVEENNKKGYLSKEKYYAALDALAKNHNIKQDELEKKSMQEKVDTWKEGYQAINDNFASIMNAMIAYNQASTQAELDNLDRRENAELEKNGFLEATQLANAEREYNLALKTNDQDAIAAKQRALLRAQIEDKYAKQRKKLEYEGAVDAWKMQVAIAAAAVPLTILNAISAGAKWGLLGMAAYGAAAAIASGIQYAAVLKARPTMKAQTGIQDYIVPDSPAARVDNYPVMASAGERVSVTPRGETNRKKLQIDVNIDRKSIFSIVQEGIDDGLIIINANNIGGRSFS